VSFKAPLSNYLFSLDQNFPQKRGLQSLNLDIEAVLLPSSPGDPVASKAPPTGKNREFSLAVDSRKVVKYLVDYKEKGLTLEKRDSIVTGKLFSISYYAMFN
jgi:hypothetical protein